jgi:hypothetical protein
LVPQEILCHGQIENGKVIFNNIPFFCRIHVVYITSNFINKLLDLDSSNQCCRWNRCTNTYTHDIINCLSQNIFLNGLNYDKIYFLKYFIAEVNLNNYKYYNINGYQKRGEFINDEQLKNDWIAKARYIISTL